MLTEYRARNQFVWVKNQDEFGLGCCAFPFPAII